MLCDDKTRMNDQAELEFWENVLVTQHTRFQCFQLLAGPKTVARFGLREKMTIVQFLKGCPAWSCQSFIAIMNHEFVIDSRTKRIK